MPVRQRCHAPRATHPVPLQVQLALDRPLGQGLELHCRSHRGLSRLHAHRGGWGARQPVELVVNGLVKLTDNVVCLADPRQFSPTPAVLAAAVPEGRSRLLYLPFIVLSLTSTGPASGGRLV